MKKLFAMLLVFALAACAAKPPVAPAPGTAEWAIEIGKKACGYNERANWEWRAEFSAHRWIVRGAKKERDCPASQIDVSKDGVPLSVCGHCILS